MNLRQRIADWIAPERRAVTVEDLAPMLGRMTASGESVSPRTAEGLAAVVACVNLVAGAVGSLPLHLYRRTDNGRERASEHYLAKILHDRPNQWQTAMEFREAMTAAALLTGNAVAERIYSDTGRLVALVPIPPGNVTIATTPAGSIVYDVTDRNGKRRRLLADEVLHLRDRSDDGIVGRSRIDRARESLGLAQAVVRHGAAQYRNGARPSGVIEAAGKLTQEGWNRLREAFRAQYQGPDNAGNVVPLDAGMKFQALSLSAADAQLVESLGWSVEEVARLFNVPPALIGAKGDSYSSTVALTQAFVTYAVRPWLVRWEQAINAMIGDGQLFAEHNLDGLLRADPKVRADIYHLGLADGWLTPNEVRRLENMPPLPGGDVPTPRTLPGPLGLGSDEQPAPSRGT